jgi:uncharacterized protein YdcH (DUF465 family)
MRGVGRDWTISVSDFATRGGADNAGYEDWSSPPRTDRRGQTDACGEDQGDKERNPMQTDLHHPLTLEFPELREAIHHLKTSNNHFRRLFDEYHEVDRQVVRIEEGIEPASDARTEEVKHRRLRLKDELYAMLQKVSH